MKIVFYDVKSYEIKYLRENCPDSLEQIYLEKSLNSKERISKEESEADILCVFISCDLSKECLSKFPNLKYVLTRSVGYNHIDLDYCKFRNIRVLNTPHYGDWTIAEFTFGILLNAVRKISQGISELKESNVNQANLIGMELHSKTIGIIGLGQIGIRVANIADGFHMNVIYYDNVKKADYKFVSLDKLCQSSDIISLHCPLTTSTRHLLSYPQFEMMRQGVTIVNNSRGEVINTQALLDNLKSKKVSYAALDVVECEEITCNLNSKNFCTECVNETCLKKYMLNQKLLSYPNVTITPHMAYNTKEAIGRILGMTIENIDCCLKNNFCKPERILI